MPPPKLDSKVTEPLTDDDLRAMLKACSPPTGAPAAVFLRCRRDEAILRLMLDSGMRAGEVVALEVGDINVVAGTAVIGRGKGAEKAKGRIVPFGAHTALALERYLRLRAHHRLAELDALWLGNRGRAIGYAGLHKALAQRARVAGVAGFHPHLMRRTAANRWLAAGGSEEALMAVAGWIRPDMLLRHTMAQAPSRAAHQAHTLNVGQP